MILGKSNPVGKDVQASSQFTTRYLQMTRVGFYPSKRTLCVSMPLNSDIFLKDLTASNGSISGNVIQLEIQGMQSPCIRQRHIFLQPVSKSDFFSAIKGQEGLRWLYWAGFPRLVILAAGHIAMPESSKFLPFLVAAWRAHWLGQVFLWCDD